MVPGLVGGYLVLLQLGGGHPMDVICGGGVYGEEVEVFCQLLAHAYVLVVVKK